MKLGSIINAKVNDVIKAEKACDSVAKEPLDSNFFL